MKWEPKAGDKVKCIDKSWSSAELLGLVILGSIYTVKEPKTIGAIHLGYPTKPRISLVEVDTSKCEFEYYQLQDFEPAENGISSDVEDAWNRAMGLL